MIQKLIKKKYLRKRSKLAIKEEIVKIFYII